MVLNVVAIVTPAPGKEARVAEILKGLIQKVTENEPDVEKYMCYKTTNAEGVTEYVFVERYKDEETLKAHSTQEYFQEVGKLSAAEGLLSKQLNIMILSPLAGFDSR